MKWRTPEPRPYYKNYDKIEVSNSNGWFDCYRLPGDIDVICEPQHLQEVNVYLIFGEEKALLKAGLIMKFPLGQGEYELKFVSVENLVDVIEIDFEMPNVDKLLKINLSEVRERRQQDQQKP